MSSSNNIMDVLRAIGRPEAMPPELVPDASLVINMIHRKVIDGGVIIFGPTEDIMTFEIQLFMAGRETYLNTLPIMDGPNFRLSVLCKDDIQYLKSVVGDGAESLNDKWFATAVLPSESGENAGIRLQNAYYSGIMSRQDASAVYLNMIMAWLGMDYELEISEEVKNHVDVARAKLEAMSKGGYHINGGAAGV